MKIYNELSEKIILEQFNEENTINQIKNIKKQLILFDLKEKEKDVDMNDNQIIKGNEQIIFSIISNNISNKINYFINTKDDSFNFELFIIILTEQIKSRISLILTNAKGIESSLFQKINKNTLKSIQSKVSKFLFSFYDDFEGTDKINEEIIIKKKMENNDEEENYMISCIKIILILNIYIEKIKIEDIFGEFKTKENKKLINKLSAYLIQIMDILIQIKKNKESFNINKDLQSEYNFFSDLIENTYKKLMPDLISFIFDIIFMK